MVIVNPTCDNSILYYTRYTQIDKYEILDHDSRLLNSGNTTVVGYNGKINHTGITYCFESNTQYTYKSYYLYQNVYYLAAHLLVQSYSGETRLDAPFTVQTDKPTYSFKSFKQSLTVIYDFGSASYVGDTLIDGGSADTVGSTILDGQEA